MHIHVYNVSVYMQACMTMCVYTCTYTSYCTVSLKNVDQYTTSPDYYEN